MENESSTYKTVTVSMITLIIGTLIGLYINSIKSRYDNKLEYIDIKTHSIENYLSTPSIAKDKLNIFWEEKRVHNVSSISIEIYNFSKTDFENVPIHIELLDKNKNDLKIVALQITGENGRKDLIENFTSNINKNEAGYSFNIKLLNRTKKENPNATVTILLANDSLPEYNIYIEKKGVSQRPYNASNADLLSDFDWFLIIVACLLAFAIYSSHDESKRKNNMMRRAAEAIEQKYIENSMKNLKVRDILHELQVVQWNHSPWYKKLLSFKPKREDINP